MSLSIERERKRVDCNSLPRGWQRDDILRKTGLSAGKVDVYYYSQTGGKLENKLKSECQPNSMDLSSITVQNGRTQHNSILHSTSFSSRSALKRQQLNATPKSSSTTTTISSSPYAESGTSVIAPQTTSPCVPLCTLKQQIDYSRNVRTDTSLVPPIRQTASIFKQPVTVIRSNRTRDVIHVKNDMQIKQEKSDKPKQLFWEKRLEGLQACDVDGSEFGPLELPKNLKPVGPNVANCTLLQSVATALHLTKQAVTGQTASKSCLASNTGVYLNPEQPLMHSVNVTEDDIKRQEDRVQLARKKLQDVLLKN